ncbi:Ankyrin repeat domain-containing protein 50 [Hondaea fermentalgiana]|uniref:Ankyrin repeat domain-containing protein 50 n=1 Tax=Hondaea fermentalgiana TaxID=2315210 RepID=A0A2R5G7W9_9STRA|nr:Ankyrin repeat domain-containing protein 50 [Hondaea fermentalgiana]|eukprot:GBG23794.1 Ankyrin repeat domain-containing protein 50 [Hondaea fermentalgiana]
MLLSRDVELKVREKALQLAVQKNNVNLARLFVEHGMDFIFLRTPPRYFDQTYYFLDKGKREFTPVGLSDPKTRSADMIELLLDHGGGNVDDINENGQSVLIQASLHGDMELAQLLISRAMACFQRLLDYGVNVHAPGIGSTAFDMACISSHFGMAKILLEKGVLTKSNEHMQTYLQMALHSACGASNLDMVKYFIENGAMADLDCLTEAFFRSELSLMHAIRNLHSDIVEELLQDGANLDMHDAQVSLFDVALEFRRHSTSRAEEMISWLFNRGAYVDFSCLKSSKAQTALKIAYDAGFVENLVANEDLAGIRAAVQQDAKLLEWIPKPLHHASRQGLDKVMEVLLDLGANVASEENGITALSVACTNGHVDAARLLLDRGADVNYSGYSDEFPLLGACREGHIEIVRMLLDRGAHVNICEYSDECPLLGACREGHIEVVRMLLNRDDKIQNREKALGIAVEKKNADLARLFVQHGMNFECLRNPFDYVGEDHNEDPYFWPKRELTLVGRAGEEEQSQEMIELFLDHGGGNVDDVDRDEFTALKYACLRGQYKLAKFLIERGAEISFDPDGTDYTSPLIIACEQSHESIVELLLDHGAHTDAPYGRDTPLMITCENGAMVSFKKLLTCDDVCIDEQNRDGCTALMIACANGHLEMVKLLLKRGAEVDMQDHKGRRALAYSANEACIQCLLEHSVRLGPRAISDEELLGIVSSRGCTSMVKELLEKGVNVNCKDRGGFTPLMRAASGTTYAKAKTLENKNFVTIAKSLVSQGAEVNAVNKRGQTALELTACKNLAHFLLDQGATYDPSHTGVYSIFSRSCEEGWVDLTRRCLQQVHKSDASKNMMDCLVDACRNQRTEIVKLLLDNGADPKAGFENWRKKAWLLKEVCVGKVNNHKLDLVQLLLQSYVCSNVKDKTAVACALHGAYEVGDLETARLLVQHGADLVVET